MIQKNWYEIAWESDLNIIWPANLLAACLENHTRRQGKAQIQGDLVQIAAQFGYQFANDVIDEYNLEALGFKKKPMAKSSVHACQGLAVDKCIGVSR